MDFFDKIGETFSSKSKDVAKKAKEMAEVASLNGKIITQKEVIRKAYLDIGQKYYEKYKQDTSNEFYMECKIVTEALDEISKIKSEIQAIKNYKVCPKCGTEVSADAAFCSKCGTQFEVTEPSSEVPEEEPDDEPDIVEKICPNCNEVIKEGTKYCTKCGYQFEE